MQWVSAPGTATRPSPLLTPRRIVMASAGLVILLAAVAAFLLRPTAKVVESSRALGKVMLSMGERLVAIRVSDSQGPVAATLRDGHIVPLRPVPAGKTLGIALIVAPPAWVPWGRPQTITRQMVTPPSPAPIQRTLTLSPTAPTTLLLAEPAQAVELDRGTGSRATLIGTGTRWQLPAASHPGGSGVWEIRTRSASWEAWSSPYPLSWNTPPWLTVHRTASVAQTAASPVILKFNAAVKLPKNASGLAPAAGTWNQPDPTTWVFQPASGVWWPGEKVHLTLPGGATGMQSRQGSYLARTTTLSWTVAAAPVLGAQELLAKLGYLPFTWTPNASGSTPSPATLYHPPAGAFAWRYADIPAPLKALWQPGNWGVMTQGAIMAFEAQHGLTVDGLLGPKVWAALWKAAAAGQVNPNGYSYVYVSETGPESLTLWQNGKVLAHYLANTGISASPTYLGTSPVYLRYRTQTMSGTNPNGTHYSDAGIPWVSYFRGGDAIHGFLRPGYGYPQSLGCVELPFADASVVWHHIGLGTLVTVSPSGSPQTIA